MLTWWKVSCFENLQIAYCRGLQTTAHGPNPVRKAFSSGPRRHFVNNQKYIYKKHVNLVECSLSQNTYITYDYDVRPSNLWVIAYVALGQKSLETLAYCVNCCSIPGCWVSLPTKRIFCDCYRNMGRFLCGEERVKRFVNVHLHCITSNLKIISKMSTLPLHWKNFCGRLWPIQMHHICLTGNFRKGVVRVNWVAKWVAAWKRLKTTGLNWLAKFLYRSAVLFKLSWEIETVSVTKSNLKTNLACLLNLRFNGILIFCCNFAVELWL